MKIPNPNNPQDYEIIFRRIRGKIRPIKISSAKFKMTNVRKGLLTGAAVAAAYPSVKRATLRASGKYEQAGKETGGHSYALAAGLLALAFPRQSTRAVRMAFKGTYRGLKSTSAGARAFKNELFKGAKGFKKARKARRGARVVKPRIPQDK